ncbi:hypothetical protein ABEB36_012401 [Hypothenemus hampei]|uniref:BTB domain-containing protein n=1 Tax=Hypothenemus hampei TaxID=57062 RepID=A0ABD1EB77_HYPHA
MNNKNRKITKYVINWQTHPQNLLKSFCSLMEHQSLVDVVICCGNNTIQAHKFVLAANSPLFRMEFEKNAAIEQVVISGCEFSILKSVVEIMYCGQTLINEENMKFLIAIVKLFEMKPLENLFSDNTNSIEEICLPKPQFLTKKPKYPAFNYQNPILQTNVATTQQPSAMVATQSVKPHTLQKESPNNVLNPLSLNLNKSDPITQSLKLYARGKRALKQQAEQACVKEAQASKLALANLQQAIASNPQANNFIIEDTCTETTVENFIPSAEAESLVKVLNSNDNSMFLPISIAPKQSQATQDNQQMQSLNSNKLKYILDAGTPTNIEIMYKDAEGNYMPVNAEVFKNLSNKDGLQFQVVDENGHTSEFQEFETIHKIEKLISDIGQNSTSINTNDNVQIIAGEKQIEENICSIVTKDGESISVPNLIHDQNVIVQSKNDSDADIKFIPDMFFTNLSSDVENDSKLVSNEDIFLENRKTTFFNV